MSTGHHPRICWLGCRVEVVTNSTCSDGDGYGDNGGTYGTYGNGGYGAACTNYTTPQPVPVEESEWCMSDARPMPPTEHPCGDCKQPPLKKPECEGPGAPYSPGMPPMMECPKMCHAPDNGECYENGKCRCFEGYFGDDCGMTVCPDDPTDPAGCACCKSNVFDKDGKCCETEYAGVRPVVDKGGLCCSQGRLDACGVCGGDGKMMGWGDQCCTVCARCCDRCIDLCACDALLPAVWCMQTVLLMAVMLPASCLLHSACCLL